MYPDKTLPTIIELLQILEKDHEEDKYLYRGQTLLARVYLKIIRFTEFNIKLNDY
jgi:hypothetical protein